MNEEKHISYNRVNGYRKQTSVRRVYWKNDAVPL